MSAGTAARPLLRSEPSIAAAGRLTRALSFVSADSIGDAEDFNRIVQFIDKQ